MYNAISKFVQEEIIILLNLKTNHLLSNVLISKAYYNINNNV